MAITPEMISEKSFSTKFKGYNMDEVDDFLDYVMDEVDKLIRENKALQEGGAGGDHDSTAIALMYFLISPSNYILDRFFRNHTCHFKILSLYFALQ